MKLLKFLAMLTVICLVSIYGLLQSGLINVAATIKDGPVITWLLHTTMEKSVERRAQNIEVPDINKNEMILAGLSDYVDMCAQCHGEPGKPSSILAQGLNPAPPEFEHLTEDGSAAEMFWIVKNGIRMTGMPAFGNTHQADEIWPVVSFLQSVRGISIAEYSRMKKEAEAYGHHRAESSMNDKRNGQYNADDHSQGESDAHNTGQDTTAPPENDAIDDNSSKNSHAHDHDHSHGH